MSQLNPNVTEILLCTEGIIGSHLCKSYLNLAKAEFFRTNGRKATLDDAQALRDLFEAQWVNWYIHRPERERLEKILAKPIWDFGIPLKIDVHSSMCKFLISKLGYNFGEKTPEIKEYNYGTYIIKNNLLEEYKSFVLSNRKDIPKYRKPEYVDFGHLAYNGVTDDM